MIDEGKIMTAEMAQRTIQGCIDAYMNYMKNDCGFTDSTLKKYRSAANTILKKFTVPFFRLDSEMLNNEIRKDYTLREWTVPHTVIVMNVINGLFYWAKFLAPNPYTLKTITLINPCTKQVDTSDSFIAKLAKKEILETSVTPVNKKQPTVHKTTVTTPFTTSNTSVSTNNQRNSNVKYMDDECIVKRDAAIKLLFAGSNITSREITRLMLFDFMHDRIIIQSQNCRSLMRVVTVNTETRNAIYDYLKTREDSHEYLFESVYDEKPIEEDEVSSIVRSVN